ncbi:ubiquitin carboxyl-terminal hydrolase isozyme L3 isoform X2 [Eumetopias jubatus]|uniref:ubiquitin carboxyl-terminal hydrolase isozyme L3 isoform X1 n=2 Tax=Pinnipedia TaxID=3072905 RepID=UPI00063C6D6A|nr:PREDICTED: ubiquitin carboxyl-terminal hydrolase isozyme L3 isoform X1 [Odobenus rosmarus divergens]XP_027961932.1 ubiquitin carboxyl-terminal hydrolase isozyme L3 isoform X1 [Eumetopias jubatus]XP_027961933.1 ubiquitin carboxyl-terminal hydrolase isozyme L3 isoform X2 [Eumetopias jubatus]XP_035935624.1 ubiquitin carboxyl-terminal hydrolase isozyme L3 isoform X1 [Halichoerus grypus]
MEGQRWLPLEANPEVTNQFLKQLGLHPNWQFVDVYGMDPELLSMVPRPVCAVLLLFPITEKYEVFRTEEEEKIKSQGQDVTSSVYFMKQTISNACGTIGLIHAIANNKDKMHFESGSTLKKFLEESVSMSPEERARYLENYDAIRVTHETSAHEGQTESSSSSSSQPHSSHCRTKASSLCHHASLPWVKRNHVGPAKATSPSLRLRRWRPFLRLPSMGLHSVAPSIDEKVDLHFIALVHVDGHLYELDGRKPFPINHGETSDETLLEDAIEVCKKFMERDPDELRFNAIALSAA